VIRWLNLFSFLNGKKINNKRRPGQIYISLNGETNNNYSVSDSQEVHCRSWAA